MSDHEIKIIRQVRHEISAEYDHDVDRVVAYYRRFEEELGRSGKFRFATRASRPEQPDATEDATTSSQMERSLARPPVIQTVRGRDTPHDYAIVISPER